MTNDLIALLEGLPMQPFDHARHSQLWEQCTLAIQAGELDRATAVANAPPGGAGLAGKTFDVINATILRKLRIQ